VSTVTKARGICGLRSRSTRCPSTREAAARRPAEVLPRRLLPSWPMTCRRRPWTASSGGTARRRAAHHVHS